MNDPAIPSNANALLREQGLRPRKRWGQNFLCDRNALDRIVRAAALQSDDRTLEIGAGLGALTRSLADFCSLVTAVEIDPLMEPILKKTLQNHPNVRLIFEDFLRLDTPSLLNEAFQDRRGLVVANIPYYITTPILERLLSNKHSIRRIVLLVQEEVAGRLCAPPGDENYGSMSVFAQYHANVSSLFKVSRNSFMPVPEVNSMVVQLEPYAAGAIDVKDEDVFFRVVHSAFGKRRKMLLNALLADFGKEGKSGLEKAMDDAGIDCSRRGETLSLKEFAKLAECIEHLGTT